MLYTCLLIGDSSYRVQTNGGSFPCTPLFRLACEQAYLCKFVEIFGGAALKADEKNGARKSALALSTPPLKFPRTRASEVRVSEPAASYFLVCWTTPGLNVKLIWLKSWIYPLSQLFFDITECYLSCFVTLLRVMRKKVPLGLMILFCKFVFFVFRLLIFLCVCPLTVWFAWTYHASELQALCMLQFDCK